MANRLDRLRRSGVAVVGALLVGAAGCAFPNGSTGGDPLLGSFNRPIVPTPPPERGGLRFDSPAHDGARLSRSNRYPARAAGQLSTWRLPIEEAPPPREPDYRVSGPTAFTPPEPPPPVQRVSYAALRDPAQVKTVEEAQALLEVLGAKGRRAEQGEDGDWICSCTVGPRAFEARAAEPLDAMRLLLEQVENAR